MSRKIRNNKVWYNPNTGERGISKNMEKPEHCFWAIERWEYILDSRGEFIGYINYNKFIPVGE